MVKLQKKKTLLSRFASSIPGKNTFGVFRFVPLLFFPGAALEYVMIHWTAGETNFYKTYKKRKAVEAWEAELREEVLADIRRKEELLKLSDPSLKSN